MAQAVFQKARQLEIKDSDNPNNWRWRGEEAHLVGDQVLDIEGKTHKTKLGYEYEAFVVFKLAPNRANIDQAYAGVGGTKLIQISLARDPTPSSDHPGYYEASLGAFDGTGTRLKLRLTGTETYSNKYGLILKGIDVRPT